MDCAEHGQSDIAKKERELTEAQGRTIVIAHDYHDFGLWCRANNRRVNDPGLIYARNEWALIGIAGPVDVVTTERGAYRLDIGAIRRAVWVIQRNYAQ